ncbi:transporter [Pukyongiella litopenaei]|uniref:Transporter n=1 Tax=Pukyongiella litopenaei TaxID=2605946 RepID=A0A2S0MQS6_9RHOB|nr:transporter [Pukyongiella litopenaei]AVO38224.1 transporter [Pukyongiella litopenaei]
MYQTAAPVGKRTVEAAKECRPLSSSLTRLVRLLCHSVTAVLFIVLAPSVQAQMGDGPRAYQLVPEDTRSVSQFYIGTRGNLAPSDGTVFRGADLDLNLGVTQYSQTLGLNGHQAAWLMIVPYGNVSGSLGLGAGGSSGSDSGLGDIKLGFAYGIHGAPVLDREAYMRYDPGLAVNFIGRVTAPTGHYDSARSLNMGGNRWALELALPIAYYLGNSFLDPQLTTFEIMPKVAIYGDNTDAPGATQTLSQRPVLSIEAHVTRNFGKAFWGSLDALYTYGGETESDGIDDNNRQRSLAVGVSGNVTFSPSTSLKVTYGEVISGNANGSDGKMFRAQLMYLF